MQIAPAAGAFKEACVGGSLGCTSVALFYGSLSYSRPLSF